MNAPDAGELVHMDVKKIGRIPDEGGRRAHGRQMGSTSAKKKARIGFDYVHSMVDDHSRYAYSEILADETAASCAAFFARVVDVFAAAGITRIEQVMTAGPRPAGRLTRRPRASRPPAPATGPTLHDAGLWEGWTMIIDVATGDLLRALTLLRAKDGEPVRLALPAGLGELTAWRGCWETIVWAVESLDDGPTATVAADELRAAATRPMISPIEGLDDGRLRVCDTALAPVAEIAAPPSPVSLLGGTDLTLPPAPANPYATVLADIDQGASKVWLPYPLLERLRARQITRLRLAPDLGQWYLSGLCMDDTHLVRGGRPGQGLLIDHRPRPRPNLRPRRGPGPRYRTDVGDRA